MATIRDNVVLIKSDFIDSVEVEEGSLFVTKGQPTSQNIRTNYSNGVLSILVKSGRKKSKPVAEKFTSAVGNGNMIPSTWGFSGSPDQLNFTFAVSVKWKNGEKSKLLLGQGSTGAFRNNWWIGSADLNGDILSTGVDKLIVEPSSVKEDYKRIDEVAKDKIPSQFHGLYDLVGKTLFKELLKDVNVFSVNKT